MMRLIWVTVLYVLAIGLTLFGPSWITTMYPVLYGDSSVSSVIGTALVVYGIMILSVGLLTIFRVRTKVG